METIEKKIVFNRSERMGQFPTALEIMANDSSVVSVTSVETTTTEFVAIVQCVKPAAKAKKPVTTTKKSTTTAAKKAPAKSKTTTATKTSARTRPSKNKENS